MIAKLIVWGADRAAAIRRLAGALADFEVVGVHTNLALLGGIVGHPAFAAGDLDTGFIGRFAETLLPEPPQTDEHILWAAAALALLLDQRAAEQARAASSNDPYSPWSAADAWRLNGDGYEDVTLRHGEQTATLRVHPLSDGNFRLDLPSGPAHAEAVEDAARQAARLVGVHRERARRGAQERLQPRVEHRVVEEVRLVVVPPGGERGLRQVEPRRHGALHQAEGPLADEGRHLGRRALGEADGAKGVVHCEREVELGVDEGAVEIEGGEAEGHGVRN
jgi:acetyl/propionyl-CoA carboxylase alpha subunit